MNGALLYGLTFDGTLYREYLPPYATLLSNAYHDMSITLLIEMWQGFKARITVKLCHFLDLECFIPTYL